MNTDIDVVISDVRVQMDNAIKRPLSAEPGDQQENRNLQEVLEAMLAAARHCLAGHGFHAEVVPKRREHSDATSGVSLKVGQTAGDAHFGEVDVYPAEQGGGVLVEWSHPTESDHYRVGTSIVAATLPEKAAALLEGPLRRILEVLAR